MAGTPKNIEKTRRYGVGSGSAYQLKDAGLGDTGYSIETNYAGESKVVEHRMGKGLTGRDAWHSRVLIKKIPESLAERFVFWKLDPENNRRPKIEKKDIRQLLKITKRAIVETDIDKLLAEYGKPRQGITPAELDMRSVLLYRGQENKIITNGFVLIRGQKPADDILGRHIETLRKKDIAKNIRLGLSEADATKAADNEVKRLSGEGRFPNWKALIPEDRVETWQVVGTSAVSEHPAAWLTNGDGKFIAVNIDMLALIYKYYPDAKITSSAFLSHVGIAGVDPDIYVGALSFEQDGEVQALLMPLFAGSIPDKIRKVGSTIKRETVADNVAELRGIHESRSDLSKASDERQEHSKVINPDDPGIGVWRRNQGRMDVRGIDTPRGKRKASKRPKRKKRQRPNMAMVSIR